MNIKDLTPGQEVQTKSGPGIFIQHKTGNFRNQSYQVELRSGERRWYTYEQLKQASKEVSVSETG